MFDSYRDLFLRVCPREEQAGVTHAILVIVIRTIHPPQTNNSCMHSMPVLMNRGGRRVRWSLALERARLP